MAYKISDIEGIGPVYTEKLTLIGIDSVEKLLEFGATIQGRNQLNEKTGISLDLILRWVNMADLFRIKGVAEEYADLLEAAGVDTVKELRNRVPANLHAKMLEVNNEKNLVRAMPSVSSVTDWVEHAKTLNPMVSH
jgi:predicted flap endonuclease-1-like 5' DNA nuclease